MISKILASSTFTRRRIVVCLLHHRVADTEAVATGIASEAGRVKPVPVRRHLVDDVQRFRTHVTELY